MVVYNHMPGPTCVKQTLSESAMILSCQLEMLSVRNSFGNAVFNVARGDVGGAPFRRSSKSGEECDGTTRLVPKGWLTKRQCTSSRRECDGTISMRPNANEDHHRADLHGGPEEGDGVE